MSSNRLTIAPFPAILLLFLLAFCASGHFVIISEVLNNPTGPASACPGDLCQEFVEITNLGADTLTLDSLFLTDGRTVDSVVAWATPLAGNTNCVFGRRFLSPGQCAIVLDRNYDSVAVALRFAIADSTVMLTVDHVSLVGGLTDTRGILLYKGTRSAIRDSLAAAIDPGQNAHTAGLVLTTPSGMAEGVSLVPNPVLFAPSRYQANPDSLDPGKCTPVTNGWLVETRVASAHSGAAAICSVAVLKVGAGIPAGTSWSILNTATSAALAQGTIPAGLVPAFFAAQIPVDTVGCEIAIQAANEHIVKVIDLSPVFIPAASLRINEIFPRATASVPEWVEIVNVSAMSINLKNWRIGTPEQSDTIAATDLLVGPASFMVLTSDKGLFEQAYPQCGQAACPLAWPTLDNYHDTLYLWNPLQAQPCEIVCYSSAWFDSWDHQSLERVSTSGSGTTARDWVLADVPSPGQPNRSVAWRAVQTPELNIGPIPFTPNGDGRDDVLLVDLQLPASEQVSITIYGFDGTVLLQIPGPAQQKFYWNGNKANGTPAPAGPFFVVATVTDNGIKHLIRKKGILWR